MAFLRAHLICIGLLAFVMAFTDADDGDHHFRFTHEPVRHTFRVTEAPNLHRNTQKIPGTKTVNEHRHSHEHPSPASVPLPDSAPSAPAPSAPASGPPPSAPVPSAPASSAPPSAPASSAPPSAPASSPPPSSPASGAPPSSPASAPPPSSPAPSSPAPPVPASAPAPAPASTPAPAKTTLGPHQHRHTFKVPGHNTSHTYRVTHHHRFKIPGTKHREDVTGVYYLINLIYNYFAVGGKLTGVPPVDLLLLRYYTAQGPKNFC